MLFTVCDRRARLFVILAGLLALHAFSAPHKALGEATLTSRISKVSLFKNGLALVEREIKPLQAGVYELDAAPSPIHGTMWIEGATGVVARVAKRQRPVKRGSGRDLQTDYAGLQVTVHLQDIEEPVTGRVQTIEENPPNDAPNYPYVSSPNAANRQFLVLDTMDGETLIDAARIVFLKVKGEANARSLQPVLLLEVDAKAANKPIHIRYLTLGLSWAPSYHVDLIGKTKLKISQTALIRNELAPLEAAEIELISGFPNIRFRHVTSPLAPNASWRDFFQQINQRPSSQRGVSSNSLAMRQSVALNYVGVSQPDISALPSGEGVDMHYESIGKKTIDVGEALQLVVSSAESDYQRIVEWVIPDSHDAYGNRVNHESDNEEEGIGEPWDALRFRNPLPLPMTTGPASISQAGRFSGQTLSTWVNRGEQTTLKVTKALSIRTRSFENENQTKQPRELTYFAGRQYARVTIDGAVHVSNHRAESVNVLVRRRFSGELIGADGDPKQTLLEEGAYSVNRRNELVWMLTLEPGATRELSYQYRLLVRR